MTESASEALRSGPAHSRVGAPGRAHIPALDGVRGCAILLVMLYHFMATSVASPLLLDRLVTWALTYGWVGVDLFFALSGFLITGILLDTRGSRGYLRNFFIRRALRILPLYYAFLAVWFVVIPALYPHSSLAGSPEPRLWWWLFLSNVYIAAHGTQVPWAINHFWSLAVEEQFYLVWPLVVQWAGSRRLPIIIASIVVLCPLLRIAGGMHGQNEASIYVLTHYRLDALAAGGGVSWLMRARGQAWTRSLALRTFPVSLAVFAAIAILMHGHRLGPVSYSLRLSSVAMTSASIVALASTTPSGLWRQAWESRGPRFLGKYSYGLYVLHVPLMFILGSYGVTADAFPEVAGYRVPGRLVYAIMAMCLTAVLAWISWRVLERPVLSLKDRYAISR